MRVNWGTIPSKTLRESALLLSGAKSRKLLGIQVARREEAARRSEELSRKIAELTEECVRLKKVDGLP